MPQENINFSLTAQDGVSPVISKIGSTFASLSKNINVVTSSLGQISSSTSSAMSSVQSTVSSTISNINSTLSQVQYATEPINFMDGNGIQFEKTNVDIEDYLNINTKGLSKNIFSIFDNEFTKNSRSSHLVNLYNETLARHAVENNMSNLAGMINYSSALTMNQSGLKNTLESIELKNQPNFTPSQSNQNYLNGLKFAEESFAKQERINERLTRLSEIQKQNTIEKQKAELNKSLNTQDYTKLNTQSNPMYTQALEFAKTYVPLQERINQRLEKYNQIKEKSIREEEIQRKLDISKNLNESLKPYIGTVSSAEDSFGNLINQARSAGPVFTEWSKSVDVLNSSLNNAFAILGYGTVLMEDIQNASIRESNRMFLTLGERSVEEANILYNKIQDLVVNLPGNDKFMTSILTLTASQDNNITNDELDTIATATAEYYAAANAKGQLNYETERELRGYLLSGSTRAFTNSMISQYIDLMKGQNTVTERANALQEALNKSGFSGMATMNSFANALERFKGRIEKGFADVGDILLLVLKPLITVYEFFDKLSGTKLTAILIGLVSAFGLFTVGVKAASISVNLFVSSVDSFKIFRDSVIPILGNIKNSFTSTGSTISSFKSIITSALSEVSTSFSNQIIPSLLSDKELSEFRNKAMELATPFEKNAIAFTANLADNDMGLNTEQLSYAFLSENFGPKEPINLSNFITDDGIDNSKFNSAMVEFKESLTETDIEKLKSLDISKQVELQNIKEAHTGTVNIINKQKETAETITNTKANELALNSKLGLKKTSDLLTLAYWKEQASNLANTIQKKANNSVTALATALNIGEANSINLVTLAENGNTTAKILNFLINIKRNIIENITIGLKMLNLSITNSNTIAESLNTATISGNTITIGAHTIAVESDTIAEASNNLVKNEGILSKFLNTIASLNEASSKFIDAKATEYEALAEEGNIFAKISVKVQRFGNTLAAYNESLSKVLSGESSLWEALTENINTDAKIANFIASIKQIAKDLYHIALRIGKIAITFALAVAEGVLTGELIAQAVAFAIANAELLLIIGAVLAFITVVEKVGESFGWWSDFGSMIDAIGSGINRLWNAFANSEPIQRIISYFQNFFYTISTFFNETIRILGVFWDALFGSEDSGTFDIVGSIIDIFGKIGDVIIWVYDVLNDFFSNNPIGQALGMIFSLLNPLFAVVFYLDDLGESIGMFMDAWNLFMDSELSTEMFTALGEAFNELKAPFQEIGEAFGEVFDAFGEIWVAIFGPAEDSEKKFNPFIELIKGFAQFIINYVVPAIKILALVIRVLLIPIRLVAFALQSIAGFISIIIGAAQSGATIINNAINSVWQYLKPVYDAIKWIVDSASGVWEFLTGTKVNNNENEQNKPQPQPKLINSRIPYGNVSPEDAERMRRIGMQNLSSRSLNWKVGASLGGNYNHQSSSSNTIINNNFGDGSIPIDARNMTQKEAARTIQSGLGGYMNARRVTRG